MGLASIFDTASAYRRSCAPLLIGLTIASATSSIGLAQNQGGYPTPLLRAVQPSGAKAGSTVEITLIGNDLDEPSALYFSAPGITAERIPDPPPKDPKKKAPSPPPPPKFRVQIPANAPQGIHDVRLIGKFGISNPRAFIIGDLPEVQEKEPNSDVPQAQRIEIGSVVNGVIDNRTDVDYFSFAGKQGEHVVISCAATSIDSRLTSFIQLLDSSGTELANNKNYREGDSLVDCTLPSAGDFFIRVCDFAYQFGGPEAFYRLSVSTRPWIDAAFPPVVEAGKANPVTLYGRNLPGGKRGPEGRHELATQITPPAPSRSDSLAFPGRLLPRAGGIEGYGYRLSNSNPVLLAFAEGSVLLDNGDNDTPDKAQAISIPSEICGRFEKKRDRDVYIFEAKKDQVITIEGFADRLRSPIDLNFHVRRLDNGQLVGDFDTHPDIPPVLSRFYTFTNDPAARIVIPADGKYELLVTSQDGAARGGVRTIYRVRVREEQPDFDLLIVGNHEFGVGLTLHRGSNRNVQVVCLRHDGFDGEVTLAAGGLPAGVTCPPQVLGPKLKDGSLVLSAAGSAAEWAGPIKVMGTATINGKKIVREARAACLVYPSPNANVPAVSRLSRSVCLAVREAGPFRVSATSAGVAVPIGGTAAVKVKVDQGKPDFKANVIVDLISGPVQANGRTIQAPKPNIAPGKDGELKITIPPNTTPGDYSLVFRGVGKLTVEETGTKKKRNAEYTAVSTPVPLTVYDTACTLKFGPSPVAIKPGGQITIPVTIERLHKYEGTFTVELVTPNGVGGLSASAVNVPAKATSAQIVLKADKGTKPAKDLAFIVRATAKVGGANLKTETKLPITVDALAPPGDSAANVKATPLLSDGASGWRYSAKVTGDKWREADFDDRGWKEVKAPFGNGEPEIANRKGTEIPEKGMPIFARRSFDVPADLLKQKGVAVRLRVASDNSAAVYINGKAADEESGNHEFSYWNREVVIAASLLRAGKNVVSVRVDNTGGSSDVFLDLAIVAEMPAPNKK